MNSFSGLVHIPTVIMMYAIKSDEIAMRVMPVMQSDGSAE